MATGDRSVDWFLQRAVESDSADMAPPGRGEWGRLSRDSFIASRTVSARAVGSEGDLRLHGVGVEMNSADLSAVGSIATAWQRAVAATGAALEQVKTLRGALPSDLLQRTALVLNASPQPGSVVLHIEPKVSPLLEAEPEGDVPMIEPSRPLADRASQHLIELLGRAGSGPLAAADELSEDLRALGPRVGAALSGLAQVLDRANIALDASWAEPEAPTVRASVTPSDARWIAQFVAGRGLDAEEQQVRGTLRTISDRERWLVEVGDDDLRMDASELDPSVAAMWHVGSDVTLTVRVASTQRPDGTTRTTMKILAVAGVEGETPS
jgi:hypothetical protein